MIKISKSLYGCILSKKSGIGFQIFLLSVMINNRILSLGVEENTSIIQFIFACDTQPLEFRGKLHRIHKLLEVRKFLIF